MLEHSEYRLEDFILENERVFLPLRLTMMTMRGEMRIRPEETGPINWILFCPWLAMRWDWGTCGGSLISLSKMVEVRVQGEWM